MRKCSSSSRVYISDGPRCDVVQKWWIYQRHISVRSWYSDMYMYISMPTQHADSTISNNNSTYTKTIQSRILIYVQMPAKATTTPHHNRFTALFPGPPGWAGARRELLDFMVQGKVNRGRHTDHPAGRHSIRTNQCPPPPSPHIFYKPDGLPADQPTASKHQRQLAHSD